MSIFTKSLTCVSGDINIVAGDMVPFGSEYAEDRKHSLAKYTFDDAGNAEKIHKQLLEQASEILNSENDIDIDISDYYTCSSCGYTFESPKNPFRCPIFGAPEDKILIVE